MAWWSTLPSFMKDLYLPKYRLQSTPHIYVGYNTAVEKPPQNTQTKLHLESYQLNVKLSLILQVLQKITEKRSWPAAFTALGNLMLTLSPLSFALLPLLLWLCVAVTVTVTCYWWLLSLGQGCRHLQKHKALRFTFPALGGCMLCSMSMCLMGKRCTICDL